MELRFDKYEGIGNDFLVVEAADPAALGSEQAVRLCDRHFGVGGDGVLLVVPSSVAGARARMIVLNADGSRPEMCGNGLRCVALHLVRAAGETQAEFDVETDAGLRHCSVRLDGPSGWITTGLGQAVPGGPWSADWSEQRVDFHRVSMGNPHTITFREPVTSEQLDDLGPLVSSCFPEGSNVEVATVESPERIRLDVWERGVGRTLACGTGAAATAVAAVQAGFAPFERPITVQLPGGPLEISVSRTLDVQLRGPARWVFQGTTRL